MRNTITIEKAEELLKGRLPRNEKISIEFKSPNFGGNRKTCGNLRSISDRGISFDGNNGKTRNKFITRDNMEIVELTHWIFKA
jgi:hypothetical protein